GFTYDARLNLERRVDGLQIVSGAARGENFTHDALDRLQCSRLDAACSVLPGATCPCDQSVTYQPNGNIDTKSDVGAYTYDPAHPHAVKTTTTGNGVDTYGYDNVGNQTDRPDLTVEYTPFDLPSKYTRKDGGTVTLLEYDGDQNRVRKTTPTEETLYFGDYERLTHLPASTSVEHRYSVRSDERVVATVKRTTQQPTDLASYLHVDHLGSIETVTSWSGVVADKRSYDAFGAKRGPDWTKTTPPSMSSTTLGYTGHEDDEGLGLVNMKGRIYDPRLARFLTTDPLVSYPTFSQSWNPYSYVMNSPLKYTDPTGFDTYRIVPPDAGQDMGLEYCGSCSESPVGANRDPMMVPRGRDSDSMNREVGNKDAGAPQADNDASPSHVVSVFGKTLASDYLDAINANAVDTGLTVGTFGLYLPYKVGSAVIKGAKSGGVLGALKAYLKVLPLPLVGDLVALDTLYSATDWRKATPAEKAETLAHAVLPAAAAVVTVVSAVKGSSGGLKPEAKYLRGGKHGIAWKEGPVLAKDGGPQGQWGSAADLAYAGVKAAMLKPGEGSSFPLPKGHTSVVHRSDGTVPANNFWVRNNGTGTFHGYPTE
ncbi:MAG: RHS repeat-associated core domain-containing protein, partial [Byssovorax sp.]